MKWEVSKLRREKWMVRGGSKDGVIERVKRVSGDEAFFGWPMSMPKSIQRRNCANSDIFGCYDCRIPDPDLSLLWLGTLGM